MSQNTEFLARSRRPLAGGGAGVASNKAILSNALGFDAGTALAAPRNHGSGLEVLEDEDALLPLDEPRVDERRRQQPAQSGRRTRLMPMVVGALAFCFLGAAAVQWVRGFLEPAPQTVAVTTVPVVPVPLPAASASAPSSAPAAGVAGGPGPIQSAAPPTQAPTPPASFGLSGADGAVPSIEAVPARTLPAPVASTAWMPVAPEYRATDVKPVAPAVRPPLAPQIPQAAQAPSPKPLAVKPAVEAATRPAPRSRAPEIDWANAGPHLVGTQLASGEVVVAYDASTGALLTDQRIIHRPRQ